MEGSPGRTRNARSPFQSQRERRFGATPCTLKEKQAGTPRSLKG